MDDKILIGGIQKFSIEDGPGIRTTVFFKGCPLKCRWCHNPELIGFEQELIRMPGNCIKCGKCMEVCPERAVYVNSDGEIDIDRRRCTRCMKCADECYAGALQTVAEKMTADEIISEVEKDKSFYDNTGGGMTISGGELLSQPDFADILIDKAGEKGIDVCLDTSGYGAGRNLMHFASKENVTCILYDMKSLDDNIHREYTGKSNSLIIENLEMLCKESSIREKIRMRMPLISGVNDDWELIEKTGNFYLEHGLSKLTLLPYHDLGVTKKHHIGGVSERFKAPEDEYVEKIKKFFEDYAHMDVEILGKI